MKPIYLQLCTPNKKGFLSGSKNEKRKAVIGCHCWQSFSIPRTSEQPTHRAHLSELGLCHPCPSVCVCARRTRECICMHVCILCLYHVYLVCVYLHMVCVVFVHVCACVHTCCERGRCFPVLTFEIKVGEESRWSRLRTVAKTVSLKVLTSNNNIEKENLGNVISFTVVCVSYALSYKNKVLIKFLAKRREYSLASGQEFHQQLSHNFPYSLTQLFFFFRQCFFSLPLFKP